MKIHQLILISVVSLLVGAGCASPFVKGDPKPVIVSQPVYSVDQGTGAIVQTGTTNIEAVITPHTLSPGVSNAIAAAQGVIKIGSSVPSPAQPIFGMLDIGLGLGATLLGLYAKKKSGQLTKSNAALAATVTVIEAAENAAALKKATQKAAMANGSEDHLNSMVKNL